MKKTQSNTETLIISALTGLLDIDKRAGTYPNVSKDTLQGHMFWYLLGFIQPFSHNMLTYQPKQEG